MKAAVAAAALVALAATGWTASSSDDRYAALQWRFVRIKYHYDANLLRAQGNDIYGEPWGIDAPERRRPL